LWAQALSFNLDKCPMLNDVIYNAGFQRTCLIVSTIKQHKFHKTGNFILQICKQINKYRMLQEAQASLQNADSTKMETKW